MATILSIVTTLSVCILVMGIVDFFKTIRYKNMTSEELKKEIIDNQMEDPALIKFLYRELEGRDV